MTTIDHAAWCLQGAVLSPTPRRVYDVPDYEARVAERPVTPQPYRQRNYTVRPPPRCYDPGALARVEAPKEPEAP